ncbi:hypothetical protein BIV25_30545 [Streptomyces sp. MUSC 14]|nr:hypothetical protein BIV25_30545 [Streptomyces sp. MUSC 14]
MSVRAWARPGVAGWKRMPVKQPAPPITALRRRWLGEASAVASAAVALVGRVTRAAVPAGTVLRVGVGMADLGGLVDGVVAGRGWGRLPALAGCRRVSG